MSSSEKDIFFPLHVPLNIALYLGFTKIQGIYLLHPNALKNIKKNPSERQSSPESTLFLGNNNPEKKKMLFINSLSSIVFYKMNYF